MLTVTDVGILITLAAIVIAVVVGLVYYVLNRLDSMSKNINAIEKKLDTIDFFVEWVKKVGTDKAIETFDEKKGANK